jgi:hypothetical protein
MKTDTLIDMLARGAGPAPRGLVAGRLGPAVLVGLVLSVTAAVVGFGPVPAAAFSTLAPWMKLGYAGALALAAGWLTARLSRPGAPVHGAQRTLAAIVLAMALIAAAWLATISQGSRMDSVLGDSWWSCSLRVLLLSAPTLAAALWAVRGLAPTRPRAAGFAAGLLSGSVGAIGYTLSCPEASPAFVAVWYTVGIALAGAAGAALGPRVLRW